MRSVCSRTSLVALLVLGACASGAEPRGKPSSRTDLGALAPFPYTAAEIREANPPGSVRVYRMESRGRSFVQKMSFLEPMVAGKARIRTERASEKGAPLSKAETTEAEWVELRDHASFPAARTVRTEERIEVPAGTFDCWLYTIRSEERGVKATARFWFARGEPGPPVRMETEQDGEIVQRMTLLEIHRGS